MQPEIITTIALVGFGIIYNAIVAHIEAEERADGYVAFLVAIGNLIIVLAATAVFGLYVGLILLIFNGAAGLPMIIGSWWRHTDRRRREQRAAVAEALRTLREDA